MFQHKKMVPNTLSLLSLANCLMLFVLKVEPNVLFNFIGAILEIDTPIRLEIISINTNDNGK